jgi:hydrogenase maturation factor
VTCGDEAVSMRVLRLDDSCDLALCEACEGERRTVEVGLLDALREGDEVLVHAGVAIWKGSGS